MLRRPCCSGTEVHGRTRRSPVALGCKGHPEAPRHIRGVGVRGCVGLLSDCQRQLAVGAESSGNRRGNGRRKRRETAGYAAPYRWLPRCGRSFKSPLRHHSVGVFPSRRVRGRLRRRTGRSALLGCAVALAGGQIRRCHDRYPPPRTRAGHLHAIPPLPVRTPSTSPAAATPPGRGPLTMLAAPTSVAPCALVLRWPASIRADSAPGH